MKLKTKIFILLITSILGLSSCNLFESSNNYANVFIQLNKPRNARDFVSNFNLKIVRDEVLLFDETSSRGSFDLAITPGENTVFMVEVLDDLGAKLYSGSSKVNIKNGIRNIVEINLTNISDENKFNFTSNYIENSGNTINLSWDSVSSTSYSIAINNEEPISIPEGENSYTLDTGKRGEEFAFSLISKDGNGNLERTVIKGSIPWLIEYRLPDNTLISSYEAYNGDALSETDLPGNPDYKVVAWNNSNTNSTITNGKITIGSNLISTVYQYNFFVDEASLGSAGTRSEPFNNITAAISSIEAQGSDLSIYRPVNILVTSAYYEEILVFSEPGVNLNGGWDPTFTTQTGITSIGAAVSYNPNRSGLSSIPSNTNGVIDVEYDFMNNVWQIPDQKITTIQPGIGEGVTLQASKSFSLEMGGLGLQSDNSVAFSNTSSGAGEMISEMVVGETALDFNTINSQASDQVSILSYYFSSPQEVLAIVRWRYNKLSGGGVDDVLWLKGAFSIYQMS